MEQGPSVNTNTTNSKLIKGGAGFGLLSGITFALNGVIIGTALTMAPFTSGTSIYIAPIVAAAMNDTISALWLLIYNISCGRFKEIVKSIKTYPGFIVCLAALIGGPFAMVAYLLAIQFVGPAYAMAISALSPVFGSILARIFLKEEIKSRVWLGIIICVTGAVLIGYVPPDGGSNPNFYIGIACSFAAALGWGSEGVLSAHAMEKINPKVAINIRQITSGIVFTAVILPLVSGFGIYGELLRTPATLLTISAAALAGAVSFLSWYSANGICGVAKGMALNITYVFWGLIFSYLFTGAILTKNLVAGAILIILGVMLVIIDPGNINEMI